jgi:D-inositol-3-phosphate glycosyltransferase
MPFTFAPERPHLLWVGDGPTIPSGFGTVTRHVLHHLQATWRISCLSINYFGDPAPAIAYDQYPANLGGDLHGVNRLPMLVQTLKPDLVCILGDPWVVRRFLEKRCPVPTVAYCPIDSPNCQDGAALNTLDLALFYTQFGAHEAREGGYRGPAQVIPHGVDLSIYHPVSTVEARRHLGLPELAGAFVVGNVNRNQPRKRLDLSISAFARWVHAQRLPPEVYLWLHAANRDRGWDLRQLAKYYGIAERLILTSEQMTSFTGVKESDLKFVYSAADVQLSTTLGEGWGLSQLESMACLRPNIVPDWSALSEWAKDAAYLVPVSHTIATPERVNTIGGVVDETRLVAALDRFYREPELRLDYATRGYALAHRPAYRWEAIAAQFDQALRGVLEGGTHGATA